MSLIIQTVFANLIDWLFKPLDNLCSQLLTGAFSGLVGSMSNDEWNVAITAANRIGWIMGFVNMALCVIGALQAAAKGSVADVIKSFAMAVLAWPLTAVCISVMITMDGIVGQITHKILTVPLNGAGTSDPFGDSIVSNLIGTIVKTTGGYDLIIRCVVDFVLFLAVLALAGMLAARDISLILLACVAPLPVMMTGWKVTRPAAAKWAQAVVGVLLSAPLSALVIMVGSGICFVSKNNPNYAESFFPALMGIAANHPGVLQSEAHHACRELHRRERYRRHAGAWRQDRSKRHQGRGPGHGRCRAGRDHGQHERSRQGVELGSRVRAFRIPRQSGRIGPFPSGLASGIKDLLPKDGQAGGADGDYTSNGGVGDDARKTQVHAGRPAGRRGPFRFEPGHGRRFPSKRRASAPTIGDGWNGPFRFEPGHGRRGENGWERDRFRPILRPSRTATHAGRFRSQHAKRAGSTRRSRCSWTGRWPGR